MKNCGCFVMRIVSLVFKKTFISVLGNLLFTENSSGKLPIMRLHGRDTRASKMAP